MATAYATIANEGRRVEPTAISHVVRDGGRVKEGPLRSPGSPEGEQVIDEEIAHKATEIMIGDVTEGIAKDASLRDRPVAGKTGTSENFFDAWFVGFTPQMVTGIWMGYGEGKQTLEYTLEYARKLNGLSGGITPAEIWKTYMEEILKDKPIEQFEGVEIPQEEEPEPQPAEDQTSVPNDETTTGAVPGGATTTEPSFDQPATVPAPGVASAAPSSVAPSSVSPTDPTPSRAASSIPASSAPASSAARREVAPSSVTPSSAAPR
jgi:penicillin-binding protein 1A